MPISKNRSNISTLNEWEVLGAPKSAIHWKDNRSAKEAAKAWVDGAGKTLPKEVDDALSSHSAFGSVINWNAEPEAKIAFDCFGGPSNIDIAVHLNDEKGPYFMAVEAKADEPFGKTIAETLSEALERELENSNSHGIERIRQLTDSLLGPKREGEQTVGLIRYQLLTASAAALAEASRLHYARALVLIHEFITCKTRDENHKRNAEDLNQYVRRLSHGAVSAIRTGEILGPFRVPGLHLFPESIDLYIGKVCRFLR